MFEVPANRTMASRRIVLATNVAETSLTVPGIRYVIDPGTARISRYSLRTKVQRLPIEAISQASANQRKGRCGRVADGICIRLYSEEDFDARPEFTDPEIQRTNLASVILQMAAARLGDVRGFPFVDPPDPRAITDGVKLLEELNAVADGRLTETGRQMARLPVDPRIARMIIESGKQGCAREILVIAAALSIQDPRERPTDNQQAADTAHRRFAQPESDFLAFLALWDYLASGSASCPARRSAACAAPSSSTTCASASGRTCTASCPRSPATSASTPGPPHPNECGYTPPCSPASCRRWA